MSLMFTFNVLRKVKYANYEPNETLNAHFYVYSWFHENGSFSIHYLNEHYQSITQFTGS